MEIKTIVENQREYFNTHQTFNVSFRLAQLKKLKESLQVHMPKLLQAFLDDLNKCEYDVYMTELLTVNKELNYAIKNLSKLTAPKRTKTEGFNGATNGKIMPEPYGVCLIVSAWNNPLELSLVPLIGAISAGNTVVLKPSSLVPNISSVIKDIVSVFETKYVACLTGDRESLSELFTQKYDFAFFTGDEKSGKELYTKVAKNLTPAILELGGKCPLIVDFDANVELSAKKCVWGKFLNAGQTSVAPDYCLVHETVKDAFLECVKKEISEQFYVEGVLVPDFAKIVNEENKERLEKLLTAGTIETGGKFEGLVLQPTVITGVKHDNVIMKEEIFGPILPIISFTTLNEEVERLKTMPSPIAVYYFTSDRNKQNYLLENVLCGSVCINDCVVNRVDGNLPFGGVKESGMGSYRGAKTFEAFSHYKSVLVNNTMADNKLKYMPYNRKTLKSIKKLCK